MYLTFKKNKDPFFGTSLTACIGPKKGAPTVIYPLGQIKPNGFLDKYKALCALYVWYRVFRIRGLSMI